ncbi:MAG: phage tail protein [Gaiellales bacterium]
MGYDDYVAAIGATAAAYAPRNTALCQGQLMSVDQNIALFSLIADVYGGNGYSTFKLPDLRGAVPSGTGQSASGTTYVIGEDLPVLSQASWPQGAPARAEAGQTPTAPVSSGIDGLALNWAITLYGYFPPRD